MTPIDDAKVKAHFDKTRKAVLKFVGDHDGKASLADMHDYCEKHWFVAHQKFSQLMEGLIADGLVEYDGGSMEATLTQKGRDLTKA